MTIPSVGKLTDDLIKEVNLHINEKKASDRAEHGISGTHQTKVASTKFKIDLAEDMRKAACELRTKSNPYDITYDDVFNYMSRFSHEQ